MYLNESHIDKLRKAGEEYLASIDYAVMADALQVMLQSDYHTPVLLKDEVEKWTEEILDLLEQLPISPQRHCVLERSCSLYTYSLIVIDDPRLADDDLDKIVSRAKWSLTIDMAGCMSLRRYIEEERKKRNGGI